MSSRNLYFDIEYDFSRSLTNKGPLVLVTADIYIWELFATDKGQGFVSFFAYLLDYCACLVTLLNITKPQFSHL